MILGTSSACLFHRYLHKKQDLFSSLQEGNNVTQEKEVANTFNDFFINRVESLKKNIDQSLVEDPLVRLKEKMKKVNTTLDYKII